MTLTATQADKFVQDTMGELPANAARAGDVSTRHFEAAWFIDFVEAHFWDKSKDSPAFGPIVAEPFQREALNALIVLDAAGRLVCVQWVVSWPRRHGKTQWCGYYELARCLYQPNQVCVIQGASEEHADEAAFARLVETIRESPCFVGETKRTQDSFTATFRARREEPATESDAESRRDFRADIPGEITVEVLSGLIRFSNGSVIRAVNAKARWGVRTSVYRATDLHAARGDEAFQAGKGSTGDSWCGLTVIDSTQGAKDQIVAKVTEAGKDAAKTQGKEGDPGTLVSHIYYEDIGQAVGKGPRWISEMWLRSQMGVMPPGDFTRHHLNLATGAGLAAFPHALIARARKHELSGIVCSEKCPYFPGSYTPKRAFLELRKRFRGSGVLIGFGFDRSMGLAAGDRSVFVATGAGVDPKLVGKLVPVFDETGEQIDTTEADPLVVFPLAIAIVPRGSDTATKRIFEQCVRLYGDPVGAAFETFQCRDLAEWAQSQGYAAQLKDMSDKAKADHVAHVCSLLAENRLALPACGSGGSALLNIEMERYAELDAKGRAPKYGGPKGWEVIDITGTGAERTRVKDDSVEGFMWSTTPLRASGLTGSGAAYG